MPVRAAYVSQLNTLVADVQYITWQPWSLFARGSLGLSVLRWISCPTPGPPHVTRDWPLQTVFHRLPFHLASSWVWPMGITNKSLAGERKGEFELIFTLSLCDFGTVSSKNCLLPLLGLSSPFAHLLLFMSLQGGQSLGL